MNSISTKGTWIVAPEMAMIYTITFFGLVAIFAVLLHF